MNNATWPRIPLANCVVSVDAGVSVNSEDRPSSLGEIGVLKTSAVSGGHFKPSENKVVVTTDRARVAVPVRGGSILLSRMNTPQLVGESCFVNSDHPSLFLPDRLWQIRVDPSRIDARWLSYALLESNVASAIRCLATGTSGSMKNIAKGSLLGIRIPIPPLREQRRIAEILTSLDGQITAMSALIDKLEAIHRALLLDCFTSHANETVPLGNLVSRERPIVYGILMPGDDVADGVPVVKVKNIRHGVISRDELIRTSPAIDYEYRRSRLRPGDVLLSIRGTVGRVCIVPPDLEGANITQDTARICVPEKLQGYVAHYLMSPSAQRFLDSETVGLAVRGINLRDVRRIEVPTVPEDTITAVCNTLDASRANIEHEKVHLSKLLQLRRGLMTDLLTGRVRLGEASS